MKPEEIARRTKIVRETIGDEMPREYHDMLAASYWLGENLYRRGVSVAEAEDIGRDYGARCLHADPWDVAEAILAEHLAACPAGPS